MRQALAIDRPSLLWLAPPVALAIVVMSVQGRVAAPAMVAAAVTVPWLFLSKPDRFRLLGMGPSGPDGPPGPVFVGFAILLAVVGTLGGLFLAASALLFGVQAHLLVVALIELGIAFLGPVALMRSLRAEPPGGGRWMAAYCLAVLGHLAVLSVGVYLNDVFGPF